MAEQTPAAPPPPAPAPATAAPASAPAAEPLDRPQGARLRASPVARRLAEEFAVDLTKLQGSGPDGRILRRDVEAARVAAQAPAPTEATSVSEDTVEDLPLTRIRQTIARRMQQSKQEAPHYYLQAEIDMTEALRLRERANAALGESRRISVNDVIILATARTLLQHPRFNALWLEDHLQLHSRVDIGIGVATEEGLLVPTLGDAATKGLSQISREARELAERSRGGNPRPEDYAGATFTISNAGVFGVTAVTPIINPPQVAILGVGAATDKPVVRDGEVVVRQIMSVVLAADHRATDGADGARFLKTLRQNLEDPGLLLL